MHVCLSVCLCAILSIGNSLDCLDHVCSRPYTVCSADLKLSLVGKHQLDNAAAAIAAAHVVREQGLGSITQESVEQGLQQAQLPGRLQVQQP